MTAAEVESVDRVLWRARAAAFPPQEFVGQESFVGAGEVLEIARRAGVGPGVRLLDVCCGVAGPGLHVAGALDCAYLGVDASRRSVDRARERAAAAGTAARFEVATVPPLPVGPFDVVLLLETMLAFRDRPALLRAVAGALPLGGRFAFSVEEGVPLTAIERQAMPASDSVWLSTLPRLRADLDRAGLRVTWCAETSRAHRVRVDALVDAYAAAAPALVAAGAGDTVEDLLAAHRLWRRWLGNGRVRTFAVVAEKVRADEG